MKKQSDVIDYLLEKPKLYSNLNIGGPSLINGSAKYVRPIGEVICVVGRNWGSPGCTEAKRISFHKFLWRVGLHELLA